MCGDIGGAARSLTTGVELLPEVIAPGSGLREEVAMVARVFAMWTNAACGHLGADDAIRMADQMIEAAGTDRFAIASICGFAATTAEVLGRWDDAGRFAETGQTVDPDGQFAFWSAQVLMHRGVALAWAGDLDAAVETFTSGVDRYTDVGGRSGVPTFQASLALHLARHGDLERARTHAVAARERLDRFGERWNESLVLITEGVLTGRSGDPARGARLLEQAVSVAAAQGALALADRARAEAVLEGWETS